MLPGIGGLTGLIDGGLDTQTVTVGKGLTPTRWGYDGGVPYGSIVDGTSNIYAGGAINWLYWNASVSTLNLDITGATNSGWVTVTVGGVDFARSAATFAGTTWTWAGAANPFGTTIGASVVATFS